MYNKKKPWRVRVWRKVEDFVEVRADNADEAVALAKVLPGIVHVFDMSAIPADKPRTSVDPLGPLGDDDDD